MIINVAIFTTKMAQALHLQIQLVLRLRNLQIKLKKVNSDPESIVNNKVTPSEVCWSIDQIDNKTKYISSYEILNLVILPLKASILCLNVEEIDFNKDITNKDHFPLEKLKNQNLKILILNCKSISPFSLKTSYINQRSVSIFRFLALSNLISSLCVLELSSCLAALKPDLEYLLEMYLPYSDLRIELKDGLNSSKSVVFEESLKDSQSLNKTESPRRDNNSESNNQRRMQADKIVSDVKKDCKKRFGGKPEVAKIETTTLSKQEFSDTYTNEIGDSSGEEESKARNSGGERKNATESKEASGNSSYKQSDSKTAKS